MTEPVPCPACGGSGFVVNSLAGDADERTARDRDQTANDEDQTWSDHDQTASDRDQRSADEDQHAADDDFAAGGDASVYQRSVRARRQSSDDRHLVSRMRDETGTVRVETAKRHDRRSEERRGGK